MSTTIIGKENPPSCHLSRQRLSHIPRDSYPSGLGEDLVKGIPVSPERYQEWLRQKRSDYSVIARKLEAVFAISLNKLGENPSREEAGVQDLEQMSGYLAPEYVCHSSPHTD